AHVHERDDPRLRVRDDVVAHDPDVGDAHRAAVEHGRHAGAHAHLVGVAAAHAHPCGGGAERHVRVDVDQARRHVPVLTLDLDHPRSLRGVDVRLYGGDLRAVDGDVHAAIDALAGVEDMSALDQQVVR